jgi:magnesium chelatase family protein
VKESRERVRAALQTSGLEFPHNKRVTVSLAPADLPKESGRFDLPIALGILATAGQIDAARWGERVLRAPHHTASAAALVGGGSPPRPGEASLAHRGILLLDELAEFPRAAREALREPLETGRIVVSPAARQADFPAAFRLVAAMNPCPCGQLGSAAIACRCTPDAVLR